MTQTDRPVMTCQCHNIKHDITGKLCARLWQMLRVFVKLVFDWLFQGNEWHLYSRRKMFRTIFQKRVIKLRISIHCADIRLSCISIDMRDFWLWRVWILYQNSSYSYNNKICPLSTFITGHAAPWITTKWQICQPQIPTNIFSNWQEPQNI